MARRHCPGCGEPLPFAARRCRRCGPVKKTDGGRGIRRWRARFALAVTAVVLVLGAVAYRVGGTHLAEWYAEFAIRNLPAPFTAWAPAETPTGAFYACVRQVARRIQDRGAVETFPQITSQNTVLLGEGRYRVRSHLDAVRESGETERLPFTCVVRHQRGRWVVDELTVGE